MEYDKIKREVTILLHKVQRIIYNNIIFTRLCFAIPKDLVPHFVISYT